MQGFVVVLGESSQNTASAAAQLNNRDTSIESAVRATGSATAIFQGAEYQQLCP
jgi:hypothetical protein